MGNKRLYNLDKYLRSNGVDVVNKKRKICYSRVSSKKQEEDLNRQKEILNKLYPGHEKISDIGSGLNNKRKGYIKILDMAIQGEIDELVVTYRDRENTDRRNNRRFSSNNERICSKSKWIKEA